MKNVVGCPLRNCNHSIEKVSSKYFCKNSNCYHSSKPFEFINGVPVLISFDKTDTVCKKSQYEHSSNGISSIKRNHSKLKKNIQKLFYGSQAITKDNSIIFLNEIKKKDTNFNLLIIGSGERGVGTEKIWEHNNNICGIDIYYSENVDIIADAHFLPLKNDSFDGVWIQAVLEHVVDPQQVVSEISRVLKEDGIVYSEVPFIQQVHEGAYDFQRFTTMGHIYLFKNFESIKHGPLGGPGTALSWSLKYFLWGLLRNKKLATIISLPFFIIFRVLDLLISNNFFWDASSGSFYMGKKTSYILDSKDLINKYQGVQK